MKIFLEGNIGSGKATLINYIKKEFNNIFIESLPILNKTLIIPEPLLQTKDKNNILQYFYNDTNKWGNTFIFQMNTFATRGKLISENINKDFIMEGSMLSDKNCFALNYYENANLDNDVRPKSA